MITKYDFVKFLKHPKHIFKGSFKIDFYIFALLFILKIFILIIKQAVTREPFIDDETLTYLNFSKLFSISLLIPLIEEFFFRGFINFKKRYIVIISFISFIIISYSFIKFENLSTFFNLFLFSVVIIIILKSSIHRSLLNFIDNYLKYLIYISSFFFAIIHFSNYESFELANVIVIMQKIAFGLFLAYITYKYNIWYALLFHSLNNLIPFLIIYLFTKF